MADIPKDLGLLARKIMNYEVTTSSGVRELTDLIRALLMDVSAILVVAAAEIFDALRHLDNGKRARAYLVARPLRMAATLAALGARRSHASYRLYIKHFEEHIHPARQRAKQRRFDATK
jgi:hypothetical protein